MKETLVRKWKDNLTTLDQMSHKKERHPNLNKKITKQFIRMKEYWNFVPQGAYVRHDVRATSPTS